MAKTGSFIAGLAVGSAVGAGLAFLLVPQTGEETRDRLRAKRENLRKIVDDVKSRVQDAVEESRGEVMKAKEELLSKFEEAQKGEM